MIHLYQRSIELFRRLEDATLVAALLIMLCMAVLQILLRNLLDTGIYWAEPFLRTLVLWVALLGAMVATREQGHINIDVLSRYLAPGPMKMVGSLTAVASAAICLVTAWYSAEFVLMEYSDSSIAFASVPTWVTELILPLAFLVMGVRFIRQLAQLWIRRIL